MTKPRDPSTFEGALWRIVGALTPEAAAAAVGKTEGHLVRWTDPDNEHLPNLRQALALDAAFAAAGLGPPPILAVYQKLLAAATAGAPPPRVGHVLSEMLDVIGAEGALATRLRAIVAPGSAGGERITASECRLGLDLIGAIRQELDEVEAALRIAAAPGKRVFDPA